MAAPAWPTVLNERDWFLATLVKSVVVEPIRPHHFTRLPRLCGLSVLQWSHLIAVVSLWRFRCYIRHPGILHAHVNSDYWIRIIVDHGFLGDRQTVLRAVDTTCYINIASLITIQISQYRASIISLNVLFYQCARPRPNASFNKPSVSTVTVNGHSAVYCFSCYIFRIEHDGILSSCGCFNSPRPNIELRYY